MATADEREKRCSRCGEVKGVADFGNNRRSSDGLATWCSECARTASLKSYHRRRAGAPRRLTGSRAGPRAYDNDGGLTHKTCPDCGQLFSLEDFPSNTSVADGRGSYCKPCHNARGQRDRERAGGSRYYHLKGRYGLTRADFDAMMRAQGGMCAACRTRTADHVDHDHATGRVRGLLCFTCNVALGNVQDDEGRLNGLIGYLRAHRASDSSPERL